MRAPGRDSRVPPRRSELTERATSAARAFRVHAWAFGASVALLTGANWLSGTPWWSFWPIAVWSVIFGVHYLVHKARTTDERWAEERAADLRSKSYDAGHMDSVAKRYGDKGGEPEKK